MKNGNLDKARKLFERAVFLAPSLPLVSRNEKLVIAPSVLQSLASYLI